MNIQEIRQNYPQYDDMSDQELMSRLQAKQQGGMPQQAPPPMAEASEENRPTEMGFSEVMSQAGSNLGPSAVQFARDLAQPVMHPIETAKSLYSLGKGAIELMIPGEQADEKTALAFGQFLKDRYGSLEAIKNTLATDPVGFAADASLVLSGGATAAGRAAGLAGKAGKVGKAGNAIRAVGSAAKAVDPLTAIGKAVAATGRGTGKLTASLIGGLGTHTGKESVVKAFQAGQKGSPDFLRNMRGQESMTTALTEAQNALANMRAKRGAQYRAGAKSFKGDNKKLDFAPIDAALRDSIDSMKEGRKWKIGADEQRKIKELENVVGEWRRDPSAHTAGGLDALKQRIDAVYPDSPKQTQAQRAITNTRNAVKQTIVDQVPEYAKTMESYEQALGLEKEIERALSLGSKASVDTTMRKLQSLTRNNANTNYGNRLELANELEMAGGGKLMEKLSGQAMNDITPRGLGKVVAGSTGIGAVSNPSLIPLLLMQSPRVVGELAYGLGAGGRYTNNLLKGMGITPDSIRGVEQAAFQSGRLNPALQDLENSLRKR